MRTEKDMYINNIIGLGYSLYFDNQERFGFYYILDYVISQAGYQVSANGTRKTPWMTQYIWNNLSNQVGFTFRLKSFGKKK
jgi:hypothetical protein